LLRPEFADGFRKAAADGDGWRIPSLPPARFGITSQRDSEWAQKRLVGQPIKTFDQPLAVAAPSEGTYVYCSKPATGTFDQFAERVRDDRKWRFHDLKTGHDAMVTAPGELAKILMSEAKG
jgi:hypothetical protein